MERDKQRGGQINTSIILLRGVMPAGKNRVPMARLREVLAEAGFGNVRTYIQSGNALVDTELPAREVEERVHELIRKHVGPDLVVMVRTGLQLQSALDNNPFQNGYDIARMFFVYFKDRPPAAKAEALLAKDFGSDKIAIKDTTAYLYIPGSYARSRLSSNNLEKALGVSATARNFNTVSKLIAMSRE